MKSFYIIFLTAILFDLIIIPSTGALAWLPRLTLAFLPFVFLFGSSRMVQVIFFITALFFWIGTNINLGVIVFALGAMLFFERWAILKIFHKDAWQTLVISSLGVIVFGFFLLLTTYLVSPEDVFLNGAIGVSFLLTTVLAWPLTFFFKKIIYAKTLV